MQFSMRFFLFLPLLKGKYLNMNGKLALYAQLLGILKSRLNDAPKRGKIHFEGVFL